MDRLRQNIIRYGDDGDFTRKEILEIRRMIDDYRTKKLVDQKMGIYRNLQSASTNMIIRSDEILEDIPLLPSINFEEYQNFESISLDDDTQLDNFILKFNFYPYKEFGAVEDIHNYDKSIKLLISGDEFWGSYNTLTLRIFNVKQLNEGYAWEFNVEIFSFEDEEKITYYNKRIRTSDYDYLIFSCLSILSVETSASTPTEIEGTNLFNLSQYVIDGIFDETILLQLDHIDVGVGQTQTEIESINQLELKPTIRRLVKRMIHMEANDYYKISDLHTLTNDFVGNVELAFSYIEEINVFTNEFSLDDNYYKVFEKKYNLMKEYEVYKYASRIYQAISTAILEKQTQYLEDENHNLSAVLLRNDEIIYGRIENIPVTNEVTLEILDTYFTFTRNPIPYLRRIDYELSFYDTDDPSTRIIRSVTLNPTYLVVERMVTNQTDIPAVPIEELHRLYEDQDTLILGKLTFTPLEENYVSGAHVPTGPFEINNTDTTRKTGVFRCRTPATMGVGPMAIMKMSVVMEHVIIIPKRAIGFVSVITSNLKFVIGFGDTRAYYTIDDDSYVNTQVQYQNGLYYGYLYTISASVIGLISNSSIYDLTGVGSSTETVELTSKDNDVLVYEDMHNLEKFGFKANVGYRSATGSFLSSSVVLVTPTPEAIDYLGLSEDINVYDVDGNETELTIKEITDAKIERCGYHYIYFGTFGTITYSALYSPIDDTSQQIITSEYALANNAVIQQLLLNVSELQEQFADLSARVEFLEYAFDEMNKKGPFFLQMLDLALTFTGPLSAAFDMFAAASNFARDVVYQNKMNRLTMGQMMTSKSLKDKNFNLSYVQNRNQYVDGYLHKNKMDRQVIYKQQNDRPYFLNGNESISKVDIAEKLDLMAVIRTGGFKNVNEIDENTHGLIKNNNDVMKGLHPTFNVWARPLETLPKPLGTGLFTIGTQFSKIRRGNIDKAFKTNTRLPFHTAGSFDDYNMIGGVPTRTRRWIGVGEPNIRNQSTSDKGAGIGGFKYDSELIGTNGNTLIWKHKPYNSETLSHDELDSLYFSAFKIRDNLSDSEKYDKLIYHTEKRIGTSKMIYSYLPDSSFSEALDLFTNKVDLKYNLLSQNCQTLMLNLLNYSQSGQALSSLTPETQAALIKARIESIERVIRSFILH